MSWESLSQQHVKLSQFVSFECIGVATKTGAVTLTYELLKAYGSFTNRCVTSEVQDGYTATVETIYVKDVLGPNIK